MQDADLDPPSSREIAGEDFLFHLYRGSELLQDNRVHEAKQELEQALGLQPLDPKGQDLLAIVYFRLGLYPRAITIYEALLAAYPDATTPRINLALCYLKTGQPGSARAELERVIQKDPSHAKAWGYLGLAFQRLGDLEHAVHAFQTGGHHGMARRLLALGAQTPAGPTGDLTATDRAAVSLAMSAAFDELDRRDFRVDSTGDRQSLSGTWTTVEPGRDGRSERRSVFPVPMVAASESLPPAPPRVPVVASPPTFPPAAWRPPATAEDALRAELLVFPRDHTAALHSTGLVLLQARAPAAETGQGRSMAVRLDCVRSFSSAHGVATRPLHRRVRGADADDAFGGATAPLMVIEGVSEVVLGPPSGSKLLPLALEGPLCVRESVVVAVEGAVDFECGRMPSGDSESVPIAQFGGTGVLVLALPLSHGALEVTEGREVVVRSHAVLGWTGRIAPRALTHSESPGRTRGLLALRGVGMVLVDAR